MDLAIIIINELRGGGGGGGGVGNHLPPRAWKECFKGRSVDLVAVAEAAAVTLSATIPLSSTISYSFPSFLYAFRRAQKVFLELHISRMYTHGWWWAWR